MFIMFSSMRNFFDFGTVEKRREDLVSLHVYLITV